MSLVIILTNLRYLLSKIIKKEIFKMWDYKTKINFNFLNIQNLDFLRMDSLKEVYLNSFNKIMKIHKILINSILNNNFLKFLIIKILISNFHLNNNIIIKNFHQINEFKLR